MTATIVMMRAAMTQKKEWTASVHTSRMDLLKHLRNRRHLVLDSVGELKSIRIRACRFLCIASWLLEHGLHYVQSMHGSSFQ